MKQPSEYTLLLRGIAEGHEDNTTPLAVEVGSVTLCETVTGVGFLGDVDDELRQAVYAWIKRCNPDLADDYKAAEALGAQA